MDQGELFPTDNTAAVGRGVVLRRHRVWHCCDACRQMIPPGVLARRGVKNGQGEWVWFHGERVVAPEPGHDPGPAGFRSGPVRRGAYGVLTGGQGWFGLLLHAF